MRWAFVLNLGEEWEADRSPKAQDRKDAGLVLLKDLVDNQFPAFAGDELDVFNLLFKLREDASRTVSLPPSFPPSFRHPNPLPHGLSRPSQRLTLSPTSSAPNSSRSTASGLSGRALRHTSPALPPTRQSPTPSGCVSWASCSNASRARSSRRSYQRARRLSKLCVSPSLLFISRPRARS